jgi:hypothetical protein
MFEINEKNKIKKEKIKNSFIYIIDNFYQYPEKVLNFFLSKKSEIHKKYENPSYNQIYFDDRRHTMHIEEIRPVYQFLSSICNQKSSEQDLVQTNLIKFYPNNFNDYKSNYWWPHKDEGYNGILYLNKNDEEYGTNLYQSLNHKGEPPLKIPEHFQPWREKNNLKLIKSIEPKFNRMVLFDGLYFLHGMNICGDRYFGDEYRINQVFFFEKYNTFSYH